MCIRDRIKNEENGILIEVENVCNNLAAAILRLASDASLRKKFGSKAIETVRNRFNAASMTREIEHVYLQVLKTKNKNGISPDTVQ